MSEPGRTSIPTSSDPKSKRPVKRRALSPTSMQANAINHLLAHPDREIRTPTGPKERALPPPPEIVANVQGSSAGAGSGEFHVYKASRRREYERLRIMDEEVRKEEADKEYNGRMEEMRRRDEEKTGKNRKRRMKRKEKGKGGKKASEMKDIEDTALGAPVVNATTPKDQTTVEEDDASAPAAADTESGIVIRDDDE